MSAARIDLSGRVALVTGASRGIGSAIARALAAAGAAVGVNYRERATAAAAVVAAIERNGGRARACGADVTQAGEVSTLVSELQRLLGPIDILVNNAGVASLRAPEQLDEAEFDHLIAGNLKSTFLCMQAVLPGMRARRWGRIVNLSSAAARSGGLVSPLYNAAKAGVEGLTRGYATRVAREGVTVNAVAPGPIDTEMAAPLKQHDIAARIPVGRLGTSDEIAEAVLLVLGNAFITGQTIAVNGGILLA